MVDSAPFDKGKTKVYAGVTGNLVAFAYKLFFQRKHEGVLSFLLKTQLIKHYQKTPGTFSFGCRIMIIENNAPLKLINKYFQNQ